MIIQWNNGDKDFELANQCEILDLLTGRPLPVEYPFDDIFYADDERGILRYFVRDDQGNVRVAYESDPQTPLDGKPEPEKFDESGKCVNEICPAYREEKRTIKIVRKQEITACSP